MNEITTADKVLIPCVCCGGGAITDAKRMCRNCEWLWRQLQIEQGKLDPQPAA